VPARATSTAGSDSRQRNALRSAAARAQRPSVRPRSTHPGCSQPLRPSR
jgi:hypothetical protein